jgi:hypothetical protein
LTNSSRFIFSDQQRDKLEEEITPAKMRLKDAQLHEVDVEAVLTVAGDSSSTDRRKCKGELAA